MHTEREGEEMTLYDFLYVDRERMRSLYAQQYTGLLQNLEKESVSTKNTSVEIGAGVAVVNGKHERGEQLTESKKDILDPHDIILTDVMTFLVDHSYIFRDDQILEPGNIVLAPGSFSTFDYGMLCDVLSAMPQSFIDRIALQAVPGAGKSKNDARKDFLNGIKVISKLLPGLMQILLVSKNASFSGVVTRDQLRVSNLGMTIQCGSWLPGEWWVLGIVDSTGKDAPNHETGMSDVAKATMTFMDLIRSAFEPPKENVLITPLVIFRKLTQNQPV